MHLERTLSWRKPFKNSRIQDLRKLYISLVIAHCWGSFELMRCFRNIKVCGLGSREQMCIDPNVAKAPTNTARTNMCRQLVQGKGCLYHANVNSMFPLIMYAVELIMATYSRKEL